MDVNCRQTPGMQRLGIQFNLGEYTPNGNDLQISGMKITASLTGTT
jgi:hypothetical protein